MNRLFYIMLAMALLLLAGVGNVVMADNGKALSENAACVTCHDDAGVMAMVAVSKTDNSNDADTLSWRGYSGNDNTLQPNGLAYSVGVNDSVMLAVFGSSPFKSLKPIGTAVTGDSAAIHRDYLYAEKMSAVFRPD